MNNYKDEIRDVSMTADHHPDHGKGMPNWCSFILGGVLTFLFVYFGVARPAAHEISMMRRQIGTLEQSVWEIAGHKGTAKESTQLLALLNTQRQYVADAKASMREIQDLHRELVAEAEQTKQAFATLKEMVAVNDCLVSNSGRAYEAASVLAVAEDVQIRLANAAETTNAAHRTSQQLLMMGRELENSTGDVRLAQDTLTQLLDIQHNLGAEYVDISLARDRMDDLLSLKDTVINETDNLPDAIETLELTTDLAYQFREAVTSFEQIRHWMIEVVSAAPMLERAKQSLEPLSEISRLSRLNPHQLRSVARNLTQSIQVARKPLDSGYDSSDLAIEASLEADQEEPVEVE